MKLPKLYPQDPLPIYAPLERGIRAMVLTGELRPGEQLPTVRQLAVDLRINANTVAKVYAELERSGVVETRKGVGTFVRSIESHSQSLDAQRELEHFVSPLLAELQRHGYTVKDLMEYLTNIAQK